MNLAKSFPEAEVELVTKDINLRIKADVFGINAKDYEPENENYLQEEMHTGLKEISVAANIIDKFYKEKSVAVPNEKFLANQYVIMKDETNNNHSAIGRYSGREGLIVPLISPSESIWAIHPRNVEQSFALDCLLNDEVLFVSLSN